MQQVLALLRGSEEEKLIPPSAANSDQNLQTPVLDAEQGDDQVILSIRKVS